MPICVDLRVTGGATSTPPSRTGPEFCSITVVANRFWLGWRFGGSLIEHFIQKMGRSRTKPSELAGFAEFELGHATR